MNENEKVDDILTTETYRTVTKALYDTTHHDAFLWWEELEPEERDKLGYNLITMAISLLNPSFRPNWSREYFLTLVDKTAAQIDATDKVGTFEPPYEPKFDL